jgi:Ring finger domain
MSEINSNNQTRFTYTHYNMNDETNTYNAYTDEDGSDEGEDDYEYTAYNNFHAFGHATFQCHICRTMVNIFDYDSHMASHTFGSFLQPFSAMSTISTISSLFGVSSNSLLPNGNNLTGVSFSNLFHSSHNFPLSLSETLSLSYQIFNDDDIFDEYEANLRLGDLIGKVEIGVSNIDNVSKIIDKDTLDDQTICPICMENIKESSNICRELICSHKYCDECISKWLSTSKRCPVCNIDIEDKLQQHNQE